MFQKMTLKSYLQKVFAAILLLAGLMTLSGALGIFNTTGNMNSYIRGTLQAQLAAKNCRIYANHLNGLLEQALSVNTPEKTKQLQASLDEDFTALTQEIDTFKSSSSKAPEMIAPYEEDAAQLQAYSRGMMRELQTGNPAGVHEILDGKLPALFTKMENEMIDIEALLEAKGEKQQNYGKIIMVTYTSIAGVVFVITTVLGILFSLKTTKNVVSSVHVIQEGIGELAKGNLQYRVEYHAKNEFGELADHLNSYMEELSQYVGIIDEAMSRFADGNFQYEFPVDFIGDFAHVQQSIVAFQKKIEKTLCHVKSTATQVDAGATQISDGAQSLAQGTTEQASSVEELSATLTDITTRISRSDDYSQKANVLGQKTAQLLKVSNEEMQKMQAAMEEMAKNVENIQEIIKKEEDISFQTNILALNAAVEAARAGASGKGFAVVAEEVRNLAQKAAEASKSTATLIEQSLASVQASKQLVSSTTSSFRKASSNSEEIVEMIGKIAQESHEQAVAIQQVTSGVEQISTVVQTNSATAEESAAASEELNAQADSLDKLMRQFTLSV